MSPPFPKALRFFFFRIAPALFLGAAACTSRPEPLPPIAAAPLCPHCPTADSVPLFPVPKAVEWGDTPLPLTVLNRVSQKTDPEAVPREQGYRLFVDAKGVRLIAHDAAGARYARQTLRQITDHAKHFKRLRPCRIDDFPDFPNRGVMIDISRNKVPQLKTLFALIDTLSALKINQLQLYTEHTFAYRNHPEVWENASPMTADDIRRLNEYCEQKGIALVANQNSFGHFEKWLQHDTYAPLAECETPCKGAPARFSLSPAVPGSLRLIRGLYDELLPLFPSKTINVGCDETVDLGKGKSKALCQQYGKAAVYGHYVNQLYQWVHRHGCTMQLWADGLLRFPDAFASLPKEVTCLIWGYSARHPFAAQCKTIADLGYDFYCCPGSCSWSSVSGRYDEMKANVDNAVTQALRYGGKGILLTAWGDFGHWQNEAIDWPGILYAACRSWGTDSNREVNVELGLNEVVYHDESGLIGSLLTEMGRLYRLAETPDCSRSVFHQALHFPEVPMHRDPWLKQLTEAKCQAILDALSPLRKALPLLRIRRSDADLISEELCLSLNLVEHSMKSALLRLSAPQGALIHAPKAQLEAMYDEIDRLEGDFVRLWRQRNREGELLLSIEPMERLKTLYASKSLIPYCPVAPQQRTFSSSAVNRKKEEALERIKDPDVKRLFANTFTNTLDTTVHFSVRDGQPYTYLITGDIPAMWLRDSSAQVGPLIPLVAQDPRLDDLIRGLINSHLNCILKDPYANAFYCDETIVSPWRNDRTQMLPGVHERKWEIDSLCYSVCLMYDYWKASGRNDLFTPKWLSAMRLVLQTFKEQQRIHGPGPYSFVRPGEKKEYPNNGFGRPIRPVGLICSAFRPSDDPTFYPFLIPSNCFAVSALEKMAAMLKASGNLADKKEALELAQTVRKAVLQYGVIRHPQWGEIFAYEVDGMGHYLLMDDANAPSLLSLPLFGFVGAADPIYQNTRAFVLSHGNPFFYRSSDGRFYGIGSPHTPKSFIWPMSLILRGLTVPDTPQGREEAQAMLRQLLHSTGGTGTVHESFYKEDPRRWTRKWFSWANTLCARFILKTIGMEE